MAQKKLWIKYDDSPARLPICVADSAAELARMCGDESVTIRTTAYRVGTGEIVNGKFASVEVDFNE